MIGSSFSEASSSLRSMSFHTVFGVSVWCWILPTPIPSCEPIRMDVSFPTAMIAYQANLECVAKPSPSSSRTEEEDPYVLPAWEFESSHTHD